MKNRRLWLAMAVGPALLSCEQHPRSKSGPPVRTQAPAVRPAPAAPRPAGRPDPAFSGYHRYRGTVGTLPVTVELIIGPEYPGDSVRCLGSYYYDQHGGALLLSAGRPWRPGQPLALAEAVAQPDGTPAAATARWQAAQPVGPVLSGTWTSAGGRRLPFVLREAYDGAVRYELLPETATGGTCQASGETGGSPVRLQATEYFLHLLGPDTLRPGLRRLQCPGPAQRRAQVQEALKGLGCDMERYGTGTYREVTYNADGLLALVQTDDENLGGAYPLGVNTAYTYDLATGRRCDVRTWLRADQVGAVARLFDQALRADSIGRAYAGKTTGSVPRRLADLPAFGLSSEGVFATLGNLGAPHAVQRLPITIPYARLAPYVRPDTPLAHLLRARGLLRP